ncbi:hypothetical protein ACHAQA_001289 [Verticillium albo-atrum]
MSADLFAEFNSFSPKPQTQQAQSSGQQSSVPQQQKADPFDFFASSNAPVQVSQPAQAWPTSQNQSSNFDAWGDFSSFSTQPLSHQPSKQQQAVPSSAAEDDEDGWGDFEVAEVPQEPTKPEEPKQAIVAPTSTANSSARPTTRIHRASTFDLMTNSLVDVDGQSNSRQPPPSLLKSAIVQAAKPKEPKLKDPNVLFDAEDSDAADDNDDDDDFGDFETGESFPSKPSQPQPKPWQQQPTSPPWQNQPKSPPWQNQPKSPPWQNQPRPPESWDWDAADGIETSAPKPSVKPVPKTAPKPTPSPQQAGKSSDDAPPPTNIPPPSVLLSIFPELLSLANTSLFKPIASQPTSIKDRIASDPGTITFLQGYLVLAAVAARIIAGRKLRWHRDKFLAQGMAISAAGAKGMKLAGVDRAQTAREDREAADVVAVWKEHVGRLRSAVAAAKAAPGGQQLRVPEVAENMAVTTAKMVPTAPKACVVCGLKRDERVGKVDFDVEDSFGEWWVEHWGHRACKNFWTEHEKQLRQR